MNEAAAASHFKASPDIGVCYYYYLLPQFDSLERPRAIFSLSLERAEQIRQLN